MGQVRNVSGEPRYVPELNRVIDVDEVADVPDERVDGYDGQYEVWEIVDRGETAGETDSVAKKGGK
ncbi:hypothetical protein ATY41_02730 [Leifsonia xyli subsp. xyli]|uniref:Uncharacterized protein n=2 Tax=Leifsonia xyli subsp. xyli TaxID=59736 RepID=Q6AC48_LEIXX|nr:hypothetical protein [Leifsonia xyli]AAT90044.1 hypothetical protein Lxx24100 [Leifsonia xyli subsp. xyli str. CTCB07]ODA89973.1 hypothetical protein ATY41_02730 [Leifsonia xyli subsp. xyli]